MESNGNALTASKEFNVPVERLYKAWTDPEELKQWWKPMDLSLSEVTNELKENGQILYKFEGESGAGLTITGAYQSVQPGERLVYTWNWALPDDKLNSEFKLEVSFSSHDAGSKIEVNQQEEAEQESVKPKEGGWDNQLNNLSAFIASNVDSTDQAGNSNVDEEKPSAGLSNTQSTDASSTPEDQEGKPDYGSQNPLETNKT
jgi:uncharacterized protein YndB with AHSA1/START domain